MIIHKLLIMSMKIWKTIIQQRKKVPIVLDDMIAGMEANEILSPIVTELFLRGRNSTFHLFLYHSLILKYLKL